MKAVILAGGLGTRISEETHIKPKPMIEIGGKPILWHILKTYSHHLATYKGKLVGTIGHLSSFSFQSSKHMTVVEGGMVLDEYGKRGWGESDAVDEFF
jgi:2-C-methyl-D-erythritol 4-phosphate cytidylyltransferase